MSRLLDEPPQRQLDKQACERCYGQGRICFYDDERGLWEVGRCPRCHPAEYLPKRGGFLRWFLELPTGAVILALWAVGFGMFMLAGYLLCVAALRTLIG